ncbi:hypothetical protein I7I51_08446 [Histoplasma capsulatum]|uniref:Uncharacterized protein n=1 Tax=Ajellomyces capsulatus TaxID=5037 RepID=A0A8A1M2W3_AJECA|nr:predicted protein [Histoplasma mississippiense (nom. inval.)]EDN03358.1 predicted protein [Histoplasma mississippiense (nom. inval.)]QSS59014.1 hypothetical protein I7I51_08446 [Histoplasma capsulatum]
MVARRATIVELKLSNTPYCSPPISARIRYLIDDLYIFFGLYIVSFFSLNASSAASNSKFNVQNIENTQIRRPRWGSSRGGGGAGGGGGGGGPGGPGRKFGGGGSGGPTRRIGRVDDIRGPECGSGGCSR